ncbi:MAG: ImmA/IrrE family metallo-endopeptidase [Nanoarchaeota archaeon]|nr:ImmA/IrrE family metallo-endopeptidase [Nanoarchaeota archaeon]MBU1632695.1 ImmA/IrrE family metallo-endopeptidase [Nanoarchaeota archaeon]MBU1875665.1 ImmA/IrrE family metallo-endopeptidase [Nanoarchaeota archaeon]
MIQDNPITVESIDALAKKGWYVQFKSLCSSLKGGIVENKILLKENLSPYERDKTLFHELVHIHYPTYLSCKSERALSLFTELQIEAITEWLGRKARADHLLLREAIKSFELEPQVYDQASYRAFRIVKEQLAFPFAQDIIYSQLPLLMD